MQKNKIDPNLLRVVKTLDNETDTVNCLVYANDYFLARRYLNKMFGKNEIKEFAFIKAFGLKTNFESLKQISNFTHIKYISSITKVFAQMNITRKVMKIDDMQKCGLNGSDITVAVIDTGICEHMDFLAFNNRIVHFEDFVNHYDVPYDDNGHGTFVSGVIGGNGFLSGGKYKGVAPNCKIIMLKALDENGETSAFTILEAMQWVFNNKKKFNIKVVCMSFGSQPLNSGDPLLMGAETLWNDGIVVVAAAGNSGPSVKTIKSPGVSPKIITVGALDDRRKTDGSFNETEFKIASFSSRGPAFNFYKPDCIACGVDIVSATCKGGEFYTHMSGTSVSAPIVSGMCALLLQKEPNLTPTQVKSKILSSAKYVTAERNSEGFGVVDGTKLIS